MRERDQDPGKLPQLYDIFNGEVANVTDYGAFVKIPGCRKQGLVHKSQMSSARIDDPSEMLAKGEKVFCKVIAMESDGDKISLSMKVVNQTSGKDLDVNNVQASQDEKKRRKWNFKGDNKIELGAELNTTCRKCGGFGHLAIDCFGAKGDNPYDLIPDLDTLTEPSVEDRLEAKAMARKLKKAQKKQLKKEKKKKKKKKARHNSSSSEDSSDESDNDHKTKKRNELKSKSSKHKQSQMSSTEDGSESDDSGKRKHMKSHSRPQSSKASPENNWKSQEETRSRQRKKDRKRNYSSSDSNDSRERNISRKRKSFSETRHGKDKDENFHHKSRKREKSNVGEYSSDSSDCEAGARKQHTRIRQDDSESKKDNSKRRCNNDSAESSDDDKYSNRRNSHKREFRDKDKSRRRESEDGKQFERAEFSARQIQSKDSKRHSYYSKGSLDRRNDRERRSSSGDKDGGRYRHESSPVRHRHRDQSEERYRGHKYEDSRRKR